MFGWNDYAVAQVGASAALVGLLFVAVSINLKRIIEIAGMADRALEAILLLTGVLVTSALLLVPGQATQVLGSELLGVGLLVWVLMGLVQGHRWRIMDAKYHRQYANFILLSQSGTLPLIVSGAVALTGSSNGLYWLVPGDLCAFAVALSNAWVLLVEINR
jgi:hypothetical protein